MAKSKIINGIDVFVGDASDGHTYIYIDNIATTTYPIVDVGNGSILETDEEPESNRCVWCRTELDESNHIISCIDAKHPTPQKTARMCCDICFADLQEFSKRITSSSVVAELI